MKMDAAEETILTCMCVWERAWMVFAFLHGFASSLKPLKIELRLSQAQ